MPAFPGNRIGGQITSGPGPVPTPLSAPVADFGGQMAIARGIQDLGQGGAQVAQAWADRVNEDNLRSDELTSIRAQADYRRRVAEATQRLDPAAPGYVEEVGRIHSEARDEVLANTTLNTEDVRHDLTARLTQASEFDSVAAIGQRRQALGQLAIEDHGVASRQSLASITNDPDAYEAQVGEFNDTHATLSPSLPPEARRALALGYLQDARAAQITGYANAGRFEDAEAVLAEHAGMFTPGKADSLGDIIDQKRNEQRAAWQMQGAHSLSQIRVDLLDARDATDFAALEDRVETEYAEGRIKPGERAAAIKEINTARRRAARESEDLSGLLAQYTSPDAPGMNSQEDADKVFQHLTKQGMDATSPRQWLLHHDRSGFAPEPVRGMLARVERSNEPSQLAVALDYMGELRRMNPGAAAQVTVGNTLSLAMAYHEMQGGDPAEAAQRAIDTRATATPEVRERRRTEAAAILRDTPGDDMLSEWGVTERGWFAEDAVDINGTAGAEAARMFSTAYELTGDEELASKMASARMADRYGISEVGGVPHLVENPPERAIERWAGQDAARVLDGWAIEEMENRGFLPPDAANDVAAGLPAVSYRPTTRTAIQIAAGERPEYEIAYRDEDGMYRPTGIVTRVPTAEEAAHLPPMVERKRAQLIERRDELEGMLVTTKDVMQAHPYSGWMQRRRAERLAAEGKTPPPPAKQVRSAEQDQLRASIAEIDQQLEGLGRPAAQIAGLDTRGAEYVAQSYLPGAHERADYGTMLAAARKRMADGVAPRRPTGQHPMAVAAPGAGDGGMLDTILQAEGGYVDDPDDRGGATNYGITRATLARVRGRPVSKAEVQNLSEGEARQILQREYFDAPQLGRLPEPLQLLAFDASVNHGPTQAVKLVQRVLKDSGDYTGDLDGRIGPAVEQAAQAAVARVGAEKLAENLLAERIRLYRQIVRRNPSQQKFLKGWLNRVEALR